MDKKLSEIKLLEEKGKEQQNKVLEITQKIYYLKKKINDANITKEIQEKELNNLKTDCTSLIIQSELQKGQIKILKSKMGTATRVLQEAINTLGNVQQDVWNEMEEFINNVSTSHDNNENKTSTTVRDDFIKMCSIHNKNREQRKEELKLEGEVCALRAYVKFQENKIKHVKHVVDMLENEKLI